MTKKSTHKQPAAVLTRTSLMRNTASVRKLIVMRAVSADGKSMPWPFGERRTRFLGSSTFVGQSNFKRSSAQSEFKIQC